MPTWGPRNSSNSGAKRAAAKVASSTSLSLQPFFSSGQRSNQATKKEVALDLDLVKPNKEEGDHVHFFFQERSSKGATSTFSSSSNKKRKEQQGEAQKQRLQQQGPRDFFSWTKRQQLQIGGTWKANRRRRDRGSRRESGPICVLDAAAQKQSLSLKLTCFSRTRKTLENETRALIPVCCGNQTKNKVEHKDLRGSIKLIYVHGRGKTKFHYNQKGSTNFRVDLVNNKRPST